PWTLTGTKFYATGSIFSSHTRVSAAQTDADGRPAPGRRFAVVPVEAPGVRLDDDWDGFGQRLTATRTAVLDDAAAEELLEVPRQDGPVPVLMEATLLALQAGIGRAALTEGTQLLRQRRRTFNTGTAA
ncbi:acyl-CoA dehydrogenase, partial [Escherichia coli]|nr:acyl-CoA dehydrogenase [Escherichia coli]